MIKLKVQPHGHSEGEVVVEVWMDGKFKAGIYPHEFGIRVVSRHMEGEPVREICGNPLLALVATSWVFNFRKETNGDATT